MMQSNKQILEQANAAVSRGDYEGFLAFCTEDTVWDFVGDQVLKGKEAVRQYMATAYLEPPKVVIDQFIAEGDFLTAVGKISMKNEQGEMVDSSYCDLWRFEDGKMAELKAFVVSLV
jgi:ketosteroid isomerase-like protein